MKERKHEAVWRNHGYGHDTSPQQRRCATRIEKRKKEREKWKNQKETTNAKRIKDSEKRKGIVESEMLCCNKENIITHYACCVRYRVRMPRSVPYLQNVYDAGSATCQYCD